MSKNKAVIVTVTVVLMATGAAWALGMFRNSEMAELEQLRDQMFASRDLPRAERHQLHDEFRKRIESLPEKQRREFFESGREQWMQRAQERMDEFFALPPEEREARLDQMIDRMLAWQKERAENPGDGNRGPGGGHHGGWANLTEAQRDQRAKQRLDRTTPKMRAQFDEFRRQFTARLEARGLDPGSFHGHGGGRGRRG